MLSERLQSIDLRKHLSRKRTYPGVFPVLHLDHIYYDGKVEVEKLDLPRTRLSLMASDHLPLVADLRVQFT
jgi:endonuclease/exonuclease/phosphatase family metal-dependent hydrolase